MLGRGDRGAAPIREPHHGCLLPSRCIGGTFRGAFPEAGLLLGASRIAAEYGREVDDRMEVIGSEQRQGDSSFFKPYWEEETARRRELQEVGTTQQEERKQTKTQSLQSEGAADERTKTNSYVDAERSYLRV